MTVDELVGSGGEIEYTKVPVVNNRPTYTPNEDLDLHFKKTNRIIDLNSLAILFKIVKATDAKKGFPYCV